MENKSIFGLSENHASIFAYAVPPLTGFIALVLERENKKVRFNAIQSIIYFAVLMIVSTIINLIKIPIITGAVSGLINLVFIISWIYLIYVSYKGIIFKVPIFGDVAYNFVYNKE